MESLVFSKESYGINITLSGKICPHHVKKWMAELKPKFDTANRKFDILLDVREAEEICTNTSKVLTYIKAYLHGRGLRRLAIVYNSSATIIHLMSSFAELGTDDNERHISSMVNSDWEKSAINWLTNGIEP